ncbi:MAG: hypothetical protein II871_00060 [Clostridia bacterium]|nr:hypothetical protein [Clostridia bacterium]
MKDDLYGKKNMEELLMGAGGDERALSDEEIEELLFSDDDMLPENAVKRISPTRRAFLLTVWGLALSSLQLPLFEMGVQFAFNEYSENAMRFPFLGVLIPFVGLLLSFFGLRALKKVNRGFCFSWLLCFLRAVLFIFGLVFTFSVLHEGETGKIIARILGALSFFSMLTQIFGVFAGFRSVRSSIGFEPRSGELIALAAWYALRSMLASTEAFMELPLLMFGAQALYLLILLALHLLTQSFDEAGYSVRTRGSRVSAWILSLAGSAAVVCTVLFAFSCLGKYRVREISLQANEGQVFTPEQQQRADEAAGIRQRLIELGVPEYAVNDLSDAEAMLFEGAQRAGSGSQSYRLTENGSNIHYFVKPNDGKSEYVLGDAASISFNSDGMSWGSYGTESCIPVVVDGASLSSDGELKLGMLMMNADIRVTSVAVELGTRADTELLKRYAFIHYFEYSPEVSFHGTEAVRIHPVSGHHQQDFAMDTSARGRLLYERGGEKLSAAFNSIESPRIIFSNPTVSASADAEMASFTLTEAGSSPDGNIYAGFSVPDGAEKVRFYIAYTVTELNSMPWAASNMGFTLVHQRKNANVTGKTAYEIIRFNSRMSDTFDWLTGSILLWSDKLRVEM